MTLLFSLFLTPDFLSDGIMSQNGIIKSEIKDEPCEDVQEYRKDETCSFFFKQEDVKLENVFVKSEWDPFYPVKQESCTVFIKEEEEEEEEGNLQSNFFFFTY